MTARDWAAVLLAVVGAAAREAGHALVTLADVLDPPIVWPERDLYVPDCFLVDQR